MTEDTQLAEYNAEVLDSQPGIREAFMTMLLAVPEPAEDAAARIVGSILKAQTVEDLDKPWDSEGMRDLLGEVVQIQSISRRPSEFGNGLGAYLGCECVVESTGEGMFVTTGSVSIVAQLVRAHALGKLPLRVIPRQADRPTPQGYFPMHLEMMRVGKRS